ncbi:MAG TPA: hypothetical protein VN420_02950 [Candidatus Fimivivens sp.]|nr:hypothetical protein [Candidatus Fimivivens sp.]
MPEPLPPVKYGPPRIPTPHEATVRECAKVLKKFGVKKVFGIVVAR